MSAPALLDPDGPGLIRRFLLPGLFVIALFVALWMRRPDAASTDANDWVLQGEAFGTVYTVKVLLDTDITVDKATLQSALTDIVERVDASMSTYQSDSELSKLNQNPSTDPVPVSPDLNQVLQTSLAVYQLSGGAFDVTIGPVINAWGFGPEKHVEPPSPAILDPARQRVGSDKLTLDSEAGTLQRARPDLYIDLSAIAKGYAVDEMGRMLEAQGFANYLVEVGGEVRARGKNAEGQSWRLGIVRPTPGGGQIPELVVPLEQLSMATSGNYRNYILHNEEVVSHAMDGRTGQPVKHGLASVSVLHADCMLADAWATALYVLGVEEGLPLAEQQKLAVLFLTPDGDTFTRQSSSSFPDALD